MHNMNGSDKIMPLKMTRELSGIMSELWYEIHTDFIFSYR